MDEILKKLQDRTFHLSDEVFGFLSGKYESLIQQTIPRLQETGFHPEFMIQAITRHRNQFKTNEYIESRIANPSTGTIDHIHAEITASIADELGVRAGYSGYALELLRFSAHLHDSDRSFPKTMVQGEQEVRNDREAYRELKQRHVRNSADNAITIAESTCAAGYACPVGFFGDMEYLILRHEIGGIRKPGNIARNPSNIDPSLDLDRLTDILTDSDSLAYFDANILTNWEESNRDTAALVNKVHFMFDRMSPEGQLEFQRSILVSEDHILGNDRCRDDDVIAIRNILIAETAYVVRRFH